MNRRKAEQWMSMAMDGELSARRQARLDVYLEKHPEVEQACGEWGNFGERLRQDPVIPPQTPAAAWQDVQRAIRLQNSDLNMVSTSIRHIALGWASAAVAAILLLAGAGVWLLGSGKQGLPVPIAVADRTQVEWIETDVPDAMSMVYEDETTGLTVIWVMMDAPDQENDHAG